jgi:hypothetical protein
MLEYLFLSKFLNTFDLELWNNKKLIIIYLVFI